MNKNCIYQKYSAKRKQEFAVSF